MGAGTCERARYGNGTRQNSRSANAIKPPVKPQGELVAAREIDALSHAPISERDPRKAAAISLRIKAAGNVPSNLIESNLMRRPDCNRPWFDEENFVPELLR